MGFEAFRGFGMLIGFAGKARSGKDTAAKYLVEKYGFNQIALADAVKQGSFNINPWILVTEAEFEALNLSDAKELWRHTFPCESERSYFIKLQQLVDTLGLEVAKTINGVREFYQKYGTEGGRDIHGERCWLEIARSKRKGRDTISDIRFSNEADFTHDENGIVVYLSRDAAEAVNEHTSEAGLCSEYYDIHINNNGTIEELYRELDKLVA